MIITFYSYKGGVGRSMALANLAELFYQAGFRALMVDWDLEAPGLERFFPVIEPQQVTTKAGVIDMLIDYKVQMASESSHESMLESCNPLRYITEIYPNQPGSGGLFLITAGRRRESHFSEYARSVLSFDWQDFYENWEGELYFDWLREQFDPIADVTLIDSRTGVTEMGGVCTYQLADVVVMFCAGNQQSLEGTFEMAQNFASEVVKDLRGGRLLKLVVVPARVEDRSEKDSFAEFQSEFKARFSRANFGIDVMPLSVEEMWDLKIPHVPYYAFRERVAVRESSNKRHEDMYSAFVGLFNQLSSLAPDSRSLSSLSLVGRLERPRGQALLLNSEGKGYPVSGVRTLIGRSSKRHNLYPELDLSGEEFGHTVSKIHAQITHLADQWYLEALPATNGTVVQEELLKTGMKRRLQHGDVIRFGGVVLTFQISNDRSQGGNTGQV